MKGDRKAIAKFMCEVEVPRTPGGSREARGVHAQGVGSGKASQRRWPLRCVLNGQELAEAQGAEGVNPRRCGHAGGVSRGEQGGLSLPVLPLPISAPGPWRSG